MCQGTLWLEIVSACTSSTASACWARFKLTGNISALFAVGNGITLRLGETATACGVWPTFLMGSYDIYVCASVSPSSSRWLVVHVVQVHVSLAHICLVRQCT